MLMIAFTSAFDFSTTLAAGERPDHGNTARSERIIRHELDAKATSRENAPPEQATQSPPDSGQSEKTSGADSATSTQPTRPGGPATSLPDVGALEADLRSTHQQLEEAGREKAAMSESLRAMRAVVAEALEAIKRTGDEKTANQALEEDLRSTRQQLEEAARAKAEI